MYIIYLYSCYPKKKHTHTTLYHIKFSYNNQLEKKKSLITVNHEIFKHGYKLKLVVIFNEEEAFRTTDLRLVVFCVNYIT